MLMDILAILNHMTQEVLLCLVVMSCVFYTLLGVGFHNIMSRVDGSLAVVNVLFWPVGLVFCAFNEKHLDEER